VWRDANPGAVRLAVILSAMVAAFAFLDEPLYQFFRDTGPQGMDDARILWREITLLGDSTWMLASCALVAGFAVWTGRASPSQRLRRGAARLRDQAAFVGVSVGGVGLLAILLKFSIGRARPKLHETLGQFHFDAFALNFKINSLPSGHAATLFALATALALLAPRWRPVFYTVAAWAAFSRVPTGQHYLSDVIAGSALGYYGARWLAARAAARGWVFTPALAPLDPADARAAARAGARAAFCGLRRLWAGARR